MESDTKFKRIFALSKFATMFDHVFSTFRDCHDRCAMKKDLVFKLDSLAVKLRSIANQGATLVEKASFEWCDNCILLMDCIGEPEERELRQQVVESSKSISEGFKQIAQCSIQYVSEIDRSVLGEELSEEITQAREAVESIRCKMKVLRSQTPEHHQNEAAAANGSSFFSLPHNLKAALFGSSAAERSAEKASARKKPHKAAFQNQLEAENTKELQAEQKDKGEEEVEQLKMECTEAINKLKAAEQFEEMVKHLVITTRTLMDNVKLSSLDLEDYFSRMSRFYEPTNEKGLSASNAAAKNREVKELKALFDSFYQQMLKATSKHNFTPSISQ